MKLIPHCILAGLLVAALASCYSPRYVYSPVAHNVPLLEEKGDNKIAAHYSFNFGEVKRITTLGKTNQGRGIDIQGAYAFTDHWAIQAAYARRWEKNYADYNVGTDDTSLITYSRRNLDIGLGYFTTISSRRQSYFQLFAGVSSGKIFLNDRFVTGTDIREKFFLVNSTRLYVQPAILVKYGDPFWSALSSRVSVVYFHKAETDYSPLELTKYQLADLNKTPEIFWEPAFINSFGFNKLPGLRIEVQLGMAFLMSDRFVDYRTFNCSAGITANLAELISSKKSTSKN